MYLFVPVINTNFTKTHRLFENGNFELCFSLLYKYVCVLINAIKNCNSCTNINTIRWGRIFIWFYIFTRFFNIIGSNI